MGVSVEVVTGAGRGVEVAVGGTVVGVGVSAGATDVGVAVDATVVGVVPTSLVHATLNSKRGAARATDRFLVEKNIDATPQKAHGTAGPRYRGPPRCNFH